MRRLGFFLLASTLAGGALAQATSPSLSSYADQIDVIGLSRAADELGDRTLALALEKPNTREEALVAVRAAAFAEEPEMLVSALKQIACGRDPVLAPEAALSLSLIEPRLRDDALAQREVLLADLKRALDSLDQECEVEPRGDIGLILAGLRTRFASKE